MKIDAKTIQDLREKTGAGVMKCREALMAAEGDPEKAIEELRKKGEASAAKKSDREAKEGVIMSYVHANDKVGVLLKLYCETDFVAKNEEFKALAKDLAMQIAATDPKADELMDCEFIKDPQLKVGDLIKEKINKVGENIQVGDFIRYEI